MKFFILISSFFFSLSLNASPLEIELPPDYELTIEFSKTYHGEMTFSEQEELADFTSWDFVTEVRSLAREQPTKMVCENNSADGGDAHCTVEFEKTHTGGASGGVSATGFGGSGVSVNASGEGGGTYKYKVTGPCGEVAKLIRQIRSQN